MKIDDPVGNRKKHGYKRLIANRGEFGWPILLGVVLALTGIWLNTQKPSFPTSPSHEFPAFQTLELKVSSKGMWRLQARREKALKEEILQRGPNDWVGGQLIDEGQSIPVRLRLKGDWTDHLQAGKWSFRVQVKDTLAYRRLKVFSLQSPRTRSFLEEWYFHQALLAEEVLTPRYDFVRLHLNGADLGIYALEEHFSKEMVEAQHHREGPLLKFNEDGMWEARQKAIADPDLPFMDLPLYEAAQPEAFGFNRILADPQQYSLHQQALAAIHQYKYDQAPAGELFDLKNMARAYALIDLFRAHHCLIWHNRRFYWEPLHARLLPVIYDGFSGDVSGQYLHGPFTGYGANGTTYYDGRMDRLGATFLAEPTFVTAYYQYLHAFTTPSYLDSLESRFRQGLQDRERYVRQEYFFYQFPYAKIREQAAEIRTGLSLDHGELVADTTGCLHNYHPVALEVTSTHPQEKTGSISFLNAYDGQGPAAQMDWDGGGILWLRIPGGTWQEWTPN